MRTAGRFLALISTLIATVTSAIAQDAYVLSQEMEGKAAIYISPLDGLAMIVDGGRGEALTARGSDGARIIDELLTSRRLECLMFVCSHPHRDHVEGIRNFVLKDARLVQVPKLVFVAAGEKNVNSLHALFLGQHKNFPRDRVVFENAENRDAISLHIRGEFMRARNVVYRPRDHAGEHGRAIVCEIELSDPRGRRTTIADFDDADTDAIDAWRKSEASQPSDQSRADTHQRNHHRVMIVSHHGSRNPGLGSIPSSLRGQTAIIPVNVNNRFGHPHPSVALELVKQMGTESVFYTGIDGTVRVTPAGVSPLRRRAQRDLVLSNHWERELRRVEARIRSLMSEPESPARTTRLAALSAIKEQIRGLRSEYHMGYPHGRRWVSLRSEARMRERAARAVDRVRSRGHR